MTHFKIPDEAVEAAAKALFEDQCPLDHWSSPMDEDERESWREGARKIIEAALPVMFETFPQYGADGCSDWFDGDLPIHEAADPFFKTRTLYRLKEPK